MKVARGRAETTSEIGLDADLRTFLEDVMSCQSLGLAAWATRIMRKGAMTMLDLKRCLVLGFEF